MKTHIETEEKCTDIGQFRRNAIVFHKDTGELVTCRATIPDTYFSIPATTDTQHGYIGIRDDGELEYRPHDSQDVSPADYRKQYAKDCR